MSTETSTETLPPNEQAAIAGVPARMVEAWNRHDAAAFADLFVPDGTLILPGAYQKGRDDIRTFMAAAYATRYKGTSVTGRPIEMKPLGPGAVALVTDGGVLYPGETEVSAKEAIRASWILTKRDGQWRLAVYHNCPKNPA